MQTYDAIVLGCGAVGSATLLQLARRGLKAVGIERFTPPHDRGSSHGRTRMIRQAYFEHPDYVPLVLRAFELWHRLEAAVGRTLYRETGLLEIGPPTGVVVPGVLASAKQHQLAVDSLSADEVTRRFPGFSMPPEMTAVFEHRAGFLHVEDCIRAQAQQAVQHGAALKTDEAAVAWRIENGNVVVETERARYEAARLIITVGAWAGPLLRELNVPLVVRRKPQYWFAPRGNGYRLENGTPSFLYETTDGVFYGFPVCGPEGMKCAEHSGGKVITDPLQSPRAIDATDLARVERFVTDYLPELTTHVNDHAPCLYTLSPDENFLVDVHPQYPQVSFAAGLSGHGFKFAPVLGEALTDLATTGTSALPIEFLSVQRFTSPSPLVGEGRGEG